MFLGHQQPHAKSTWTNVLEVSLKVARSTHFDAI